MENLINKLPQLSTKLSVVFAGVFLLFGGILTAAIVTELAQTLSIDGSVSEPFSTQITAVSAGVIDDPQTVSGVTLTPGSAPETLDVNITNNANQPIDAWLEYSCGSLDASLTSDFVEVKFDGVEAERSCDDSDIAYAYRKSTIESFAASTTESPQISYEFPITQDGYFTGDFSCEVNVVADKAC